MKLILECPIEDEYAELTLEGSVGDLKLRHEDLMVGAMVVAQLHDDNFWRLHKDLDEWPEVDGWSHIRIEE